MRSEMKKVVHCDMPGFDLTVFLSMKDILSAKEMPDGEEYLRQRLMDEFKKLITFPKEQTTE